MKADTQIWHSPELGAELLRGRFAGFPTTFTRTTPPASRCIRSDSRHREDARLEPYCSSKQTRANVIKKKETGEITASLLPKR
jgi:hypothetical protein